MSRGIVEVPAGGIPATTDKAGWRRFLAQINEALRTQAGELQLKIDQLNAAVILLADRAGISLTDVLQNVDDTGRLTTQYALPTINVGNVSSVQDPLPLSATSSALTSTINIDAHILQTDFGAIAYNAGSISGLTLNTRYYILTTDPDYLGGAVVYTATTNKPTITSASGLYLVGSIVTPIAANSASITNATGANPIVFTTGPQGWNTGDLVQFAGLPGDFGSNLNGQQKTITVLSPTTFSIPVDGTTYAAYTSGGSATRIVDSTLPDYGGGGGGLVPAWIIALIGAGWMSQWWM